jgi:hypothetical protein
MGGIGTGCGASTAERHGGRRGARRWSVVCAHTSTQRTPPLPTHPYTNTNTHAHVIQTHPPIHTYIHIHARTHAHIYPYMDARGSCHGVCTLLVLFMREGPDETEATRWVRGPGLRRRRVHLGTILCGTRWAPPHTPSLHCHQHLGSRSVCICLSHSHTHSLSVCLLCVCVCGRALRAFLVPSGASGRRRRRRWVCAGAAARPCWRQCPRPARRPARLRRPAEQVGSSPALCPLTTYAIPPPPPWRGNAHTQVHMDPRRFYVFGQCTCVCMCEHPMRRTPTPYAVCIICRSVWLTHKLREGRSTQRGD